MAVLFGLGLGLALWSELQAPKLLSSLGVSGGNLEGKEVRFGVVPSVLFGQITTAVACGAVNSAHESFCRSLTWCSSSTWRLASPFLAVSAQAW